jgi:predicted transcriptional regulator
MPKQRIDVEKIREILRLRQELKFSVRKIANALQISKTSVGEYLAEFKRSGLSYHDITQMSDTEVVCVFEKNNKSANPMYESLAKEFPTYEKELARVGVTLYLLWEEYKESNPEGFSYSRFCHHYRMWESKLKAGMHIEHKAGDLLYADFTGKKMHWVDAGSGEVKNAEIFVTITGASQLIYVEAVKSQQLEDWIWANENAWRYYGGATGGSGLSAHLWEGMPSNHSESRIAVLPPWMTASTSPLPKFHRWQLGWD